MKTISWLDERLRVHSREAGLEDEGGSRITYQMAKDPGSTYKEVDLLS